MEKDRKGSSWHRNRSWNGFGQSWHRHGKGGSKGGFTPGNVPMSDALSLIVDVIRTAQTGREANVLGLRLCPVTRPVTVADAAGMACPRSFANFVKMPKLRRKPGNKQRKKSVKKKRGRQNSKPWKRRFWILCRKVSKTKELHQHVPMVKKLLPILMLTFQLWLLGCLKSCLANKWFFKGSLAGRMWNSASLLWMPKFCVDSQMMLCPGSKLSEWPNPWSLPCPNAVFERSRSHQGGLRLPWQKTSPQTMVCLVLLLCACASFVVLVPAGVAAPVSYLSHSLGFSAMYMPSRLSLGTMLEQPKQSNESPESPLTLHLSE